MSIKNKDSDFFSENLPALTGLGISEAECAALLATPGGVERLKERIRSAAQQQREREKGTPSILAVETEGMDRLRREQEQQGHRRFARVNAREHHERKEDQQMGMEAQAQSQILQHPALNNQRFDGIDPNVNPEPPLNTDARREFDNAQREQQMEKQLRLGHMPKFSAAPKPQGP